MVACNEAGRYLDAVLASLPTTSVHIFDDRSTDETANIAEARGAVVTRRRSWQTSFLEHEGAFRECAWHAFEAALSPRVGDWVLAIDCDEFLVAPINVEEALSLALSGADATWSGAVSLPIPEVFEVRPDGPYVRVDGYWAGLSAPRLFRYQRNASFNCKKMGCGSQPTYVNRGHAIDSGGLALAHYGYATAEDRRAKYDRYMGLSNHGGHDHNPAHIHSILSTPVVEPLGLPAPSVWRGKETK
jgi:glycosyltransferase involved in cell wall biosynthesis